MSSPIKTPKPLQPQQRKSLTRKNKSRQTAFLITPHSLHLNQLENQNTPAHAGVFLFTNEYFTNNQQQAPNKIKTLRRVKNGGPDLTVK
jgi:hypothetical protein